MPKLDLNLLGPLDALLTEQNVTRAACRLGVSQPTMSGILQRLRHHFDDQLLVRAGQNLELTSTGEALVGPVREALSRVDAVMKTTRAFGPARRSADRS